MSDPHELVVTQHVPAPVEEVWEAWTSAEGWARWWWPHWPDTRYEVDARPGGTYLARSAQGDAGVTGEFVALDPLRALELTWRWDGEEAVDGIHVELAPEGGGTLVSVRHTMRPASSDSYRQGWEFVLGNLARVLSSSEEPGAADVTGSAPGQEAVGGVSEEDLVHLRRCVELAATAVESGDEPFGSLLVGPDGDVLLEDHNHVAGGDQTQHPEFAIARWAAQHLTPDERAASTVYTSGEHCAMCAAAHGWVGLGRIVYAASTQQLGGWLRELGVAPGPVAPLPITAVVPSAVADGPAPELADEVRALHERFHRGASSSSSTSER